MRLAVSLGCSSQTPSKFSSGLKSRRNSVSSPASRTRVAPSTDEPRATRSGLFTRGRFIG